MSGGLGGAMAQPAIAASMGMTRVLGGQGMPLDPSGGKKAVHVKWAGKTIALGTFPQLEADEKCAKAKALTRAWRSTMRPKPDREWVMQELERLGVRVVSGRLGRKEGGGDESSDEEGDETAKKTNSDNEGEMNVTKKKKKNKKDKKKPGACDSHDEARLMGGAMRSNSLDLRTDSLSYGRGTMTPTLLSASDRNWGSESGTSFPRRNSSLAMALLHGEGTQGMSMPDPGRSNSLSLASRGSPDPGIPPHRPLVGGGSAAAYEAARADHYRNLAQQQKDLGDDTRLGNIAGSRPGGLDLSTSLGVSGGLDPSSTTRSLLSGAGGMGLGLSVNPNQHYEMLKLHHMNLLNEIQETTLMMNLYQQQQLQQQHLQHQSQKSPDPQSVEHQLHQLAQQQQIKTASNALQLEQLYGVAGASQQYSSLHPQASALQQMQQSQLGSSLGSSLGSGLGSSSSMQALLLQQQQRLGTQDLSSALPDSRLSDQGRMSSQQAQDTYPKDLDPQRQIEKQEALLRKMKDELRKRHSDGEGDRKKNEKKQRKNNE